MALRTYACLQKEDLQWLLSELRTAGVNIDMNTLVYYMNEIRQLNRPLYDEMAVRVNPREFRNIFESMNVTNFGRAMAYLALVHTVNASEELKRKAVRLVAEPLRSFDANTWWARDRWFYMILKRIYD
jgi:hypothetical protein